jgi:hypothetical protein
MQYISSGKKEITAVLRIAGGIFPGTWGARRVGGVG